MASKFALVIANTQYTDPGLAQLTAPGQDAKAFVRVLDSPEICAFDDVIIQINETASRVSETIDYFFSARKPDDLLIMYFSGHGVRDEYGSLYLAVQNTNRARLRSTAIKADFIREAMDQSRSKRQILILDCCNSGAFAQGTKAEIGGSIGTAKAFEGTGYGRVILTASDSTQFAWEGDKVIGGDITSSLFTHFLVKGLEGEADLDWDGRITIDELYDYSYEQVVRHTPKQTPGKWSYKQQGEIFLRENLKLAEVKPAPLPVDVLELITHSNSGVRKVAVQELITLLEGKHLGLARSAQQKLREIAENDDSLSLRRVAAEALTAHGFEAVGSAPAVETYREKPVEKPAAPPPEIQKEKAVEPSFAPPIQPEREKAVEKTIEASIVPPVEIQKEGVAQKPSAAKEKPSASVFAPPAEAQKAKLAEKSSIPPEKGKAAEKPIEASLVTPVESQKERMVEKSSIRPEKEKIVEKPIEASAAPPVEIKKEKAIEKPSIQAVEKLPVPPIESKKKKPSKKTPVSPAQAQSQKPIEQPSIPQAETQPEQLVEESLPLPVEIIGASFIEKAPDSVVEAQTANPLDDSPARTLGMPQEGIAPSVQRSLTSLPKPADWKIALPKMDKRVLSGVLGVTLGVAFLFGAAKLFFSNGSGGDNTPTLTATFSQVAAPIGASRKTSTPSPTERTSPTSEFTASITSTSTATPTVTATSTRTLAPYFTAKPTSNKKKNGSGGGGSSNPSPAPP